ncbi:hypothetical protein FB451DRAFT_1188163 [Mycena latifolia]|nr:hypothetical protein FB451DRAFT_1188163 [Mycena latifolia]
MTAISITLPSSPTRVASPLGRGISKSFELHASRRVSNLAYGVRAINLVDPDEGEFRIGGQQNCRFYTGTYRFDYAGFPHSEELIVAPKVLTGTEWEIFPRDCDAPVNSSWVCAYGWFWGLTTQNGNRNHWASDGIMPTLVKKRGAPGFLMIIRSSGLIFCDIVDDIHFLSLALSVAHDVSLTLGDRRIRLSSYSIRVHTSGVFRLLKRAHGNIALFTLNNLNLNWLTYDYNTCIARISLSVRGSCQSVRRAPWAADQAFAGTRRQAEGGRQPSAANPHSQVLPETEIPLDDDLHAAGMIPEIGPPIGTKFGGKVMG